jgi:membrane dipeptidase
MSEYAAAHPTPRATVVDVADHVDHVRQVAGLEHVGVGGDFDGFCEVPPVGLEDVAAYPNLIAELRSRNWSATEIDQVMWSNAVRVLSEVEASSHRHTEPSLATIEQLDRH